MIDNSSEVTFDPKVFLATVGGGRTISNYRINDLVFSQGDPSDAVFYIRKGKIKLNVISDQGKEAVIAVLGPDEFCGEECLVGQPSFIRSAALRASLNSGSENFATLGFLFSSNPYTTIIRSTFRFDARALFAFGLLM